MASAAHTDPSNGDSARKLSPNDVISVTVYQEDDLATKATIEKSGMIMLPLLGEVQIAGLTTAEATAKIQKLYDKDYLVNPQVNIIVEELAKRRYSVLGEVQHAGSYEFPPNQTVNLLEAIATAGSYTRLGNPAKVSIRRVEGGVQKVYQEDAGAMAKDKTHKAFEVLPDDVITVGESTF
jgi:polysaccharide export outer membrane protein